MTIANPILEAFRTDPEQNESWIVSEYLTAIEEYRDRPESEFDEDANLRLFTYFRVSRCGATPEQVDEAYAHLTDIDDRSRTQ